MVIEHIFDTIALILNKNRRGFVKTSQKITAVKQAMYDFFTSEVNVYRKTGVLTASVKPFVKTIEIILVDGNGNLPPDFAQEVVFETSCGNEGTFLTQEEFKDREKSTILAPEQQNPIAKLENSKIFLQPDEFTGLNLVYIRTPVDFVYATTVDVSGRSVSFDEASSTDIEFGVEDSGEIIRIALLYLGVAFQNKEAMELAIASIKNDNAQ
jgi:hypothetical protein